MDERSVCKTVSQLRHCYASNRRAADPLQFYVVNLDTKAKKVLDGINGWQQWDVHLLAQPLAKLWDDREIVYLTADSENVLSTLDEQKVYVIGGLLDHNHQKGLCLRRAIEKGYAHAKLPIGDFVQMSTRKVLAINHVFEILLHFTRDPNWERAFLAVIPKRKLPQQAAAEVVVEELESTNGAAASDRTAAPNGDGESGASNDKEHGDVVLVIEDDGDASAKPLAPNDGHRSAEEDGDQRRENERQPGEGGEKSCELISSDQCHPSPPVA
ncbi:hypothetical protein niasHT_030792 [Heterodera trifolii]|uniref:tRNA (guanine(9)-N(1))-methyltransferase n=1 Tax=Heterodera trifolii TaxID=157864 RepID=A0ABD2HU60_9BILA